MNASHNSTSSVEAEKNDEVNSSSSAESEVGGAVTNEIGEVNSCYTVTIHRGSGEFTLELSVSLSFLQGYLETVKQQGESKNKICKKPRIIHKNIIRVNKECFKR